MKQTVFKSSCCVSYRLFGSSRLPRAAGFQRQVRQSSGQQGEGQCHLGGDLWSGGRTVVWGRGVHPGHPLPEPGHPPGLRQQGHPAGVGRPPAVQPRRRWGDPNSLLRTFREIWNAINLPEWYRIWPPSAVVKSILSNQISSSITLEGFKIHRCQK